MPVYFSSDIPDIVVPIHFPEDFKLTLEIYAEDGSKVFSNVTVMPGGIDAAIRIPSEPIMNFMAGNAMKLHSFDVKVSASGITLYETQYDIIYAESIPDSATTAESFLSQNFLADSQETFLPLNLDFDIPLNFYSDRDCKPYIIDISFNQLGLQSGLKTTGLPKCQAGINTIYITPPADGSPHLLSVHAGHRCFKIWLALDDGNFPLCHTSLFKFQNKFGCPEFVAFHGDTENAFSESSQIVSVNGSLCKISTDKSREYTLSSDKIPFRHALIAQALIFSSRTEIVKSLTNPESSTRIIVTDLSGSIKDAPSEFSSIKLKYEHSIRSNSITSIK